MKSFYNIFLIIKINFFFFYYIKIFLIMGIGDWGLGIGDWGLGPIPQPQNPNPQKIIKKK